MGLSKEWKHYLLSRSCMLSYMTFVLCSLLGDGGGGDGLKMWCTCSVWYLLIVVTW